MKVYPLYIAIHSKLDLCYLSVFTIYHNHKERSLFNIEYDAGKFRFDLFFIKVYDGINY